MIVITVISIVILGVWFERFCVSEFAQLLLVTLFCFSYRLLFCFAWIFYLEVWYGWWEITCVVIIVYDDNRHYYIYSSLFGILKWVHPIIQVWRILVVSWFNLISQVSCLNSTPKFLLPLVCLLFFCLIFALS